MAYLEVSEDKMFDLLEPKCGDETRWNYHKIFCGDFPYLIVKRDQDGGYSVPRGFNLMS